jgi:transposase-like protein
MGGDLRTIALRYKSIVVIAADFPNNLIDFKRKFSSERACLNYIRKQRWGSETGFICPKCKHDKCYEGKSRHILYCAKCKHQASITAGTAYHGTRKALEKWFWAMFLVASSKQGISAKELQRQLGFGSYQTAWTWLHKLRSFMVLPDRKPLRGAVEVDESYIGGEAPGTARGRSVIKKTAVACAVEIIAGRGMGRIRLGVIKNASKEKLEAFVKGELEPESIVHTDGWRGYLGIERSGFAHIRTISPPKESHIHFPRVHRVFSLLKRWVLCTHQGAVSRKHLQSYLDEYVFRFNRRTAKETTSRIFQTLAESAVSSQSKPYWKLVGRVKGGQSMRQDMSLLDIMGEPHDRRLSSEDIMAAEAEWQESNNPRFNSV